MANLSKMSDRNKALVAAVGDRLGAEFEKIPDDPFELNREALLIHEELEGFLVHITEQDSRRVRITVTSDLRLERAQHQSEYRPRKLFHDAKEAADWTERVIEDTRRYL